MQITIHVPRSAIRHGLKNSMPDPWNEIATATIGVPTFIFNTTAEIRPFYDPIVVKLPRSAQRAMKRYMEGTLDTGVRFRITIPDKG